MTAVGIIPARYASTRFPGKPLAEIAGKPMIQHVWERAGAAERLRACIVATDDERIAACCRSFGAPVAMTSADHPTGTDRLAEVARGLDDDVIVNIQGDEPLIESAVIDATIDVLLASSGCPMATVAHPAAPESLDDPNRVKVVLDRGGFALYFSRSAIPHPRHEVAGLVPLQHIGLYAYRRDFLIEFVTLERTPAEQAEELEQLRVLENGRRIRVAVIDDWSSIPVDVPEDVALVEARLAEARAS